jgi:hypothetical protein
MANFDAWVASFLVQFYVLRRLKITFYVEMRHLPASLNA